MRQKGMACKSCGGHRLHVVRLIPDPDSGVQRRAFICTTCETVTPIPKVERLGTSCPKCGDCRKPRTRHTYHIRGGITLRERQCRHCRHRFMERSVIVTNAV